MYWLSLQIKRVCYSIVLKIFIGLNMLSLQMKRVYVTTPYSYMFLKRLCENITINNMRTLPRIAFVTLFDKCISYL